MDDNGKITEDSDLLVARVLQEIKADKLISYQWNTRSLVLLYTTLVAILVLELEKVSVGIVTAIAVVSLLVFIILNRIHSEKLKKQVLNRESDGYKRFLTQSTETGGDGAAAIETTLSHREIQILELIAEGNINKQIARELGLSPATVRNHVSRLMQKLDVNDRTAAVVLALSNGWININREKMNGKNDGVFHRERELVGGRW
jgi:DNA-binding CsgD family transcriptional regulator